MYGKDYLVLVVFGLVLFVFWALPLVVRQLLKDAQDFSEAQHEFLGGAVALLLFLLGALLAGIVGIGYVLFW